MHDEEHGQQAEQKLHRHHGDRRGKGKRAKDAEEEGDDRRVSRSQKGSWPRRAAERRAKSLSRDQRLRQCPQLNPAGIEPVMRKPRNHKP